MNQMLVWGAPAVVLVIFILIALDEKGESRKGRDKTVKGPQPDKAVEPKKAGAAQPSASSAPQSKTETTDAAPVVQLVPIKPMLPPPGERRIEAIAPRNMGRRK